MAFTRVPGGMHAVRATAITVWRPLIGAIVENWAELGRQSGHEHARPSHGIGAGPHAARSLGSGRTRADRRRPSAQK